MNFVLGVLFCECGIFGFEIVMFFIYFFGIKLNNFIFKIIVDFF